MDERGPLVLGQSDQRTYRAQYLKGNDVVGLISETISITTTP